MAHTYHPQCGCASCCRSEEAAEQHDELIDSIVASYAKNPAKVAEADEWADGEQSGEHYSEVERALADLHSVEPADLLGSEVLARLYLLAKVHGAARAEKLRDMAEDEISRMERAA